MATIVITHTRADGTLLTGSAKGDGVFDIVRRYGFWSSRSLGCLYIRMSRDKAAQMLRIDGAAEALRAAGHEVTVSIDDDTRRPFAEAEAEREERAEDRAHRFAGYAANAERSSAARFDTAHRVADGIPAGQPILVGHHSQRRAERDQERIDTNMRAGIADAERARHWADRAGAAGSYAQHRNNPQRTLRRLERLRADLRRQQRFLARATAQGRDWAAHHARNIADLADEIAHWERVIKQAKDDGVKLWTPEDFAVGDFVMYSGSWYEIKRVNRKTLSIAWNLRLAPKAVMTVEDATINGKVWTHTADYSDVMGRCPGAVMRAFLAEGKVPDLATAREADEAAPASPAQM